MTVEQGSQSDPTDIDQQNSLSPTSPLISPADIVGGTPLTDDAKYSTLGHSCTQSSGPVIPQPTTPGTPDTLNDAGTDMAQARHDLASHREEATTNMHGVQSVYHYLQRADTARLNLNHFPVRADRIADDLNVSPQEVMMFAEQLVQRGQAERVDIAEEPYPFYRIRIRRERNRRGSPALSR